MPHVPLRASLPTLEGFPERETSPPEAARGVRLASSARRETVVACAWRGGGGGGVCRTVFESSSAKTAGLRLRTAWGTESVSGGASPVARLVHVGNSGSEIEARAGNGIRVRRRVARGWVRLRRKQRERD